MTNPSIDPQPAACSHPKGEAAHPVTVTLSAEHAERAYSGVDYLIYGKMDDLPEPWSDIGLTTGAVLYAWLENARATVHECAAILDQFERDGVVNYTVARQLAFIKTGEDVPLPAPTTGPVTITWTVDEFNQLAAHHEGRAHEDDDGDVHAEIAAAIRKQLRR